MKPSNGQLSHQEVIFLSLSFLTLGASMIYFVTSLSGSL